MAVHGDTLYVAGGFTAIGSSCGGGVPLDPASGRPLSPYPKVAGEVRAVASDGLGGWYLGGQFHAVGGVTCENLAHVSASGEVAPSYARSDGPVYSLALDGGILFVGGAFTSVNGSQRSCFAALDAKTAALLPWDARISGAGDGYTRVNAIVPRDVTVYVGGDFAFVGDSARRNVAAIDIATATALPFRPDPDGRAFALATSDTTLYIGGTHLTIGGQESHYLTAVDLTRGLVRDWDPGIDSPYYDYDQRPHVLDLRVASGRLYVAGHFTRAGGEIRGGVAAFDLETGTVEPWNPHPVREELLVAAPYIFTIGIADSAVYVSGYFDSLGAAARRNLAAVSASTGLATAWDARLIPNDAAYALAHDGTAVYVGGYLSTLWDWEPRNGLAAFDLSSGRLLPWAPMIDGYVTSMAVDSSSVYLGGRFGRVGSELRQNFAAVDHVVGTPNAWAPDPEGAVEVVALDAGRVYLGGWFRSVAGTQRLYLAALSRVDGTLTAWNPSPNYLVNSIVPAGSTVYVGGAFDDIGYQRRRGLAEVDATDGRATAWDPLPDNETESIAVSGGVVYVGGFFRNIGGAARHSLAAIDRSTGLATAWNPDPSGSFSSMTRVVTIQPVGSLVYVAGDFGRIGGADHRAVAALAATDGAALPWDPSITPYNVSSLALHGQLVYLGGGFSSIGAEPAAGLGAHAIAPQPPAPRRLSVWSCAPNPASSTTTVDFEMSTAARVNVSVFDVQGRKIATIFRDQEFSAGRHSIPVPVSELAPGWYLVRVAIGDVSGGAKLLVIQ